jgi:N-acetyl sugar amidotransferase
MKNSKKSKIFRICKKCIMDSTDPGIFFNSDGVCNHCLNYQDNIFPHWENLKNSSSILFESLAKLKSSNSKYDCLIGLSGGLDSSYSAYYTKSILGLNPLLFHVDTGWNTNQATDNIRLIANGLNLDLYTEVINWDSMSDMQLAFLKSQISDQDLPQDAAIFSSLYKFAIANNIKLVITGSNYSTESCREPEEWGGYLGLDKRLFKSIHSKYGNKPFEDFPIIDIFVYKFWYKFFHGMKIMAPLNYINFNKKEAEKLLNEKFGWMPFKHKHHESRFTRFYEDFWLPKKFGFDKRKAHLSSLIMTKQLKRSEALKRIKTHEMSEIEIKNEFSYVASKLGISINELENLFNVKNKTFRNYSNKRNLIKFFANILIALGIEKRYLK